MRNPPRICSLLLYLVGTVALSACGGDATTSSSDGDSAASDRKYPDIVKVVPTQTGDGVWDLAVTVSSPYDTPGRYADGWRVLDAGGETLGEMTLDHDHASEQPFTRDQIGLEIPADVSEVTVEGRNQDNGYGGKTVTVRLDG